MLREGRLVGGEVSLLVSVREKPSSCWGAGEWLGCGGVRQHRACGSGNQLMGRPGIVQSGDRIATPTTIQEPRFPRPPLPSRLLPLPTFPYDAERKKERWGVGGRTLQPIRCKFVLACGHVALEGAWDGL